MGVPKDDLSILTRFYDYISEKYSISCEAGMLLVEKMLTLHAFKRLRLFEDPQNALVNDKVALYSWLRPEHLEITADIPMRLVDAFRRIEDSAIPSIKINSYMCAIKGLYAFIGPKQGQDVLFPALVYCLVKAQITDIAYHVKFMRLYRRRYYTKCSVGCTHGFTMCVRCDCLRRTDWADEDCYYLVMATSAIEFISKLEFYSLSVSTSEFNHEISMRIEQMNITGKKRIS